MNNAQLNIPKGNIVLMMNSDSDTPNEVTCGIQNLVENKYTLNCRSSEEIKGDLEAAISFIDNDILIINFDEYYDSQLELEKSTNDMRIYFYKKNKGGMNAGAIVGIILACAAAVACIFILIISGRKKNNDDDKDTKESSIVKMN